jgi:tetratricopeptide (TPR) repeat protein
MHFSSRKISLAGILVFALLFALPAMAQTRIFRGKVSDDKGQPIQGATIIIQGVDSKSRTFTTKTDKKGTWLYMGLPDGFFNVGARAQGFTPAYQANVKASIQEEQTINLQLQPGEDKKFFFEMTREEIKKLEEEAEKAKQKQKFAADVQALFDEGVKLADGGDNTAAIEKFKKALELDPQQANILGNMGEAYKKLGKLEEALDCYLKAVAISPNDAVLYTNLGVIYDKMGKRTESQEAFQKAAAINPGGSAQSYFNLGATLANGGRTDEAIEAFRKAIAADANFAEAYYQLGMSLSGKPDTMQEAIKSLQKYVQIGQKQDQIDVAKAIIQALEQSLKKK